MSLNGQRRIRTVALVIIAMFYMAMGQSAFAAASSSTPATTNTPATTAAPSNSKTEDSINLPLQDIQRFATVISQVKRYYVEPVDDKELFNYAISGMLSSLDPHSDYLDEEALKDLETATTGKFAGIGIEVMPENGVIKIVSPIDGTPAYEAGIKPGDLIVRINGKFVGDMTLREAIALIRGKKGTKVNLTIVRKNEKKPLQFDVMRDVIKIKTVKAELLGDGYAYIRVSFFQNETRRDLYNAIKDLKAESKVPLKGVIIDLRNNPGGLLDSAIDITNMFLNSKKLRYKNLIVYTKGHVPGGDIEAKATGEDILNGLPMVVLINEGSASASEIVAGALQDQQRATIVGEKSFGKGSVQTVLPIDYNTAIKLTTALYYTPSGRSIQAKGIEPDVVLPEMDIPKDDGTNGVLLSITEADLKKHLAGGSMKESSEDKTDESADETALQGKVLQEKSNELLHSDFQLYQAFNVLKGLSTYSREKVVSAAPAAPAAVSAQK